jgi:hypothetical protein
MKWMMTLQEDTSKDIDSSCYYSSILTAHEVVNIVIRKSDKCT